MKYPINYNYCINMKSLEVISLLLLLASVLSAQNCVPIGVRTFLGESYFNPEAKQLFKMQFNTESECVKSFVYATQGTYSVSVPCSSTVLTVTQKTNFTTYIHQCSFSNFNAGEDIKYGAYGVDSKGLSYLFENRQILINLVDTKKDALNQFITFADWSPIKTTGYIPLTASFDYLLKNNRTAIQGILLNGDIGYDLDTNECQNYIDFIKMISQISTVWPVIIATGNHEYNTDNNWKLYTKSFLIYNMTVNQYQTYVFKHLTLFTFDPYAQIYGTATKAQTQAYLANIKTQLTRTKGLTTWRVASSHYPAFCSYTSKNCTNNNVTLADFWSLFNDQSFSMYIGAHSHTFERLYPYYKGNITHVDGPYSNIDALVTVVQGVAGNDKDIIEDKYPLKNFTVKATFNETGFGILAAHSASRLTYSHYSTKGGLHVQDFVEMLKSKVVEEEPSIFSRVLTYFYKLLEI